MSLFKIEKYEQDTVKVRQRKKILQELIASYEFEPDITLTDVQQHLQIVQKEIKNLIRKEKSKR